jgi:hypothetical protein
MFETVCEPTVGSPREGRAGMAKCFANHYTVTMKSYSLQEGFTMSEVGIMVMLVSEQQKKGGPPGDVSPWRPSS